MAVMSKVLAVILILAGSWLPALAQQQLDAATKEDVDQLLEISGTRARMQQLLVGQGQQAVTLATDAYQQKHPDATPLELRKIAEMMGNYWQTAIQSFSTEEIIEAVIPVYQRHLTHADVQSIVEFYQSSAGQKLLKEMPAMMSESMQASSAVVKKHVPDMLAAAEKAFGENKKSADPGDDNSNPVTPK